MLRYLIALTVSVHLVISAGLVSDAAGAARPKRRQTEAKLYYLAEKAFQEGFYDVAAEKLRAFLDNFPRSRRADQARLILGQSLIRLKKYADAEDIFHDLIKLKKSRRFQEEVGWWLGRVLLYEGKYEAANKQFKKLARRGNRLCAAYSIYANGLCLIDKGVYDEALAAFDSVAREFPDIGLEFDSLIGKARALMAQARYETARKLLVTGVEEYKEHESLPQAFFVLGELNMKLREYEDALKFYRKSIIPGEDNPWHADAAYGIGWCHLQLKGYSRAMEVFSKLSSQKVTPHLMTRIELSRAKTMLLHGKPSDAEKLLGDFLSSEPVSEAQAEANYLMGEAYLAQEKFTRAVESYDAALGGSPSAEILRKAHFAKGLALQLSKHPTRAIESFEKAHELAGDNRTFTAESLKKLAEIHYEMGDYKKAIEILELLLKEYAHGSERDELLVQIGWCQYKLGDHDRAIESFETLLAESPRSEFADEALYRMAGTLSRKGDFEASTEKYKAIAERFPKSDLLDKAAYQLGIVNYNVGNYYPALFAFQKVVENFPESKLVMRSAYEIGWCYYQMGEERKALAHFGGFIEKYPDSALAPEVLFWMAQHFYNQDNLESAAGYFQDVAERYPGHDVATDALYWAARCAFGLKDYKKASETFAEFGQRYPKSDLTVDALYHRAVALMALGEFSEAVEIFEGLNTAFPGNYLRHEIALQNGNSLMNLGEPEKAAESFLVAAQSPSPAIRASAILDRGRALVEQKDFARALEQFMEVVWEYPAERAVVGRSAMLAGATYEELSMEREAIKIYQIVIRRNLKEAGEAKRRIEAIKSNYSIFLTN